MSNDTLEKGGQEIIMKITATGAAAMVGGLAFASAIGVVLKDDNTTATTMVDGVQFAVTSKVDQGTYAFGCPTDKKFYAYDAVAGTNNFGPDQRFSTAQQGVDRLQEKINCDRLYGASLFYFIRSGEELPQKTAEAKASEMGVSNDAWEKVVDAINNDAEWGIASYELVDMGQVRYDSLGMVWGANRSVQPTLTSFGQEPPVLGQVLVLKLRNGQIRLLRVECDLQPSVKKFVGVPVFKPAPPTSIPSMVTTPPPVTITTPPPVITTTPPVICTCDRPCGPLPPECFPPVICTCDNPCGPLPPECIPVTTTTPAPKDPHTAPGNGGPGTGGPGGGQPRPTTPKPATEWTPPPSTYTAPPPPAETQATQAPTVTMVPTPRASQTTAAPSSEPRQTATLPPVTKAPGSESQDCPLCG